MTIIVVSQMFITEAFFLHLQLGFH